MVSNLRLQQLALLFEEVTEEPHFEKTSFRVSKKIFATLNAPNRQVTLKLSEIDQSVLCAFDKNIIYPVDGAWGKQGWTIVELSKIREEMLKDALTLAYCCVAPKRLAIKYLPS
jgi:hypothetical protein